MAEPLPDGKDIRRCPTTDTGRSTRDSKGVLARVRLAPCTVPRSAGVAALDHGGCVADRTRPDLSGGVTIGILISILDHGRQVASAPHPPGRRSPWQRPGEVSVTCHRNMSPCKVSMS